MQTHSINIRVTYTQTHAHTHKHKPLFNILAFVNRYVFDLCLALYQGVAWIRTFNFINDLFSMPIRSVVHLTRGLSNFPFLFLPIGYVISWLTLHSPATFPFFFFNFFLSSSLSNPIEFSYYFMNFVVHPWRVNFSCNVTAKCLSVIAIGLVTLFFEIPPSCLLGPLINPTDQLVYAIEKEIKIKKIGP